MPYKGGPNDICDNGTLYSVQACLLGLIEKPYFNFAFWIRRYPGCKDINGPDNTIAAALYSPEVMFQHGRCYWWNFNCQQEGKFTIRSWLGRMPGLVGLIKWMNGKWCPVTRFVWNMGVLLTMTSKKRDQNGNLHTSDHLLCETVLLHPLGKLFFYPWVRKLWRRRIDYDFSYPGINRSGLNSMVRLYFPEGHPFTEAWQ